MVYVMIAPLDLISYWSRSRVDVACSWWVCAGFACLQGDF